MTKMPPIEKIPEAYTAIEDNRVNLFEDYALVKSSNNEKEYTIKWNENTYYSNDNSTYWQGYTGYPVIAVLMLQSKLTLNRYISKFFKNVNWNKLNKDNKRDYHASLLQVLEGISDEDINMINQEIDKVFEEIKALDIVLTKKKI